MSKRSLREKCPYSDSECGKIRTRITPNTDTFYAVVTMNILPTRTRFFILSSRKMKACRSSKLNFSSSYFIADDSHVEISSLQ